MKRAGILFVVGLALLSSCGANARQEALTASLHTIDATGAAFSTWDGVHQDQIVADASSKELGAAELAEYRQERAVVETAFATAYRALAVAALNRKHPDIAGVVNAVESAIDLVHQLEAGR